jgi:hypothetical protein
MMFQQTFQELRFGGRPGYGAGAVGRVTSTPGMTSPPFETTRLLLLFLHFGVDIADPGFNCDIPG